MSLSASFKAQRRWSIAVWCIPLIALAMLFRDILFSGKFFFDGDSLAFYQYFILLKRGGQWLTPEILGGFPLYASVNGMWFYPPTRILLSFLDSFAAYHTLFFLNLVAAYGCMYGFARSLKLRHDTSIAVGMIYLFSGQLMMWASLPVNTNYYYLLPAVLWLLESGKKWSRPWVSYFFSGVLLGSGWLSGHVQFIAVIHLGATAYLLFRILWGSRFIKTLGAGFTVFVTSICVGLPQILPIVLFAPYTARAQGVGLKVFFDEAYRPQDLIHYLLPFWNNAALPAPVPNLFIGIMPFFLLIAAFMIPRRLRGSSFNFFLAVYAVCLITAFKYSPFGYLLFHVPFFSSFRQLPRLMLLGNFAAAVAVGYSVESLYTNRDFLKSRFTTLQKWVQRGLLFIVLPVVALASFLYGAMRAQLTGVFVVYFRDHLYAGSAHLPFGHYVRVIGETVDGALYQFSIFDPMVVSALCFGFISLVLFAGWHRYNRTAIQLFIICLIAANAIVVYGSLFTTVPLKSLTKTPRSVAVIKSDAGTDPFRIYSLFTGLTGFNDITVGCPQATPEERLDFQKEFIAPNLNIMWELDSIDGYENFMTGRISELLAYLGSERATVGELLVNENIPLEERTAKFVDRINLLASLNVKYVISPVPLAADNILELTTYTVTSCNVPVYVYRLENVWPRYFLTRQVATVPEGSSFSDLLDALQRSADSNAVLIESDEPVASDSEGRVSLTPVVTDTTREFTVHADSQALLYIGDAWLPGWKASLDSTNVEILHAQYGMMGLLVPAGEHTITLTYNVSPLAW